MNLKSIASGLALYLATIYGLYGYRDNGFADSKALDSLGFIMERKNAAKAKDKTAYYAQIRKARLDAMAKRRPKWASELSGESRQAYVSKPQYVR